MLRTVGRTAVIAGTASSVSGRVSRRQQGRWAEQDAQQQQEAQQQQAAEPATDDATTKLAELAKLHQQGVLTDDEFAAAKAKVLGI
jgi:membrane protease subunit (stomatin/prohibitin family)